jgi:hypothetical protein
LLQIPSRETESRLVGDLCRCRLRGSDCQLPPEFPDSETAGNALLADSVETGFIAVLLGHGVASASRLALRQVDLLGL